MLARCSLAAALLCAGCADKAKYRVGGVRFYMYDNLDVPKHKTDRAMKIYKHAMQEVVDPAAVAKAIDKSQVHLYDRVFPNRNLAGFLRAKGDAHVRWLTGYQQNSFFHELTHIVIWELMGHPDKDHEYRKWWEAVEDAKQACMGDEVCRSVEMEGVPN